MKRISKAAKNMALFGGVIGSTFAVQANTVDVFDDEKKSHNPNYYIQVQDRVQYLERCPDTGRYYFNFNNSNTTTKDETPNKEEEYIEDVFDFDEDDYENDDVEYDFGFDMYDKPDFDKEQDKEQDKDKDKNPNNEPDPEEEEEDDDLDGLHKFEIEVAKLVNIERANYGLDPLVLDEKLCEIARFKSEDMSRDNYFNHVSPTYGGPADLVKYFNVSYKSVAENIAKGQTSPAQVVQAWMNSAPHRATILNGDLTHLGVGYVANGNYWTQIFTKY
ncbi:MAG: hypothetical protein ATN35_12470 [Epulopiscium sp. Nele67-Bin004]|nr:MAG: hypothetical protein ATN35_12470 [Epulopiscium sp. Nele67-Bin004]